MHKYRANYPDNESVAEKDIHKFSEGQEWGIRIQLARCLDKDGIVRERNRFSRNKRETSTIKVLIYVRYKPD